MPASKLCLARQKKVQILAQLFFSNLCKPEHLQQIKDTGALTPTYSMRHRCTRERERERQRESVCVSWATTLDGRWFTNGLVQSALEHLLTALVDVVIPFNTPGFCMEQWLTASTEEAGKDSVVPSHG